MIDFTTTAMARPKIVDRTFASFNENLEGLNLKEQTLYINIDPLPTKVNRASVVAVCNKYFGTVVANMPDEPNYTAAYNWVWGAAKSKLIMNIEDDWVLKRKVKVRRLIKFFEGNPGLYEVALRAYSYKYDKTPTSPAMLHRRFYKAVAGNLDITINPETQLRGTPFGLDISGAKVIAYPETVILQDIGREWLEKSEFRRPPKKARFITWVKK